MYQETINLAWNRRMLRMMNEVVERNDRLRETGGHVIRWMFNNYIVASAMTFRRELDRQGGTENLRHLLEEVESRPQVVNRKRSLERVKSRDEWELQWANDDFDKLPIVRVAGDSDGDHIDPLSVRKDREQLEEDTEHVREYVERTYAHRTPQGATPVTFGEFHAAVDAMVLIFEKYYALLTGRSVAQVEPVPQFNTHECFTFPWWDPSKGPSKE
jgi:hypothetical protein